MNAEQFAMFMKAQQDLLAQVSRLTVGANNTGAVQSSNNIINTALVPNFDVFDPAKETYRSYIQRFDNYVNMKGISSMKEYCTKLLLNSIGAKHFNMVTALAAPKAVTELAYDELLKLLENHLAPKKNVLVAQHKFLSKYQNEGQSVADFVAVLRTDINDCEFISECRCKSSIADVFLRAQFIRGIRDNNMREQLLQAQSSKFEEIVSKALALEAARCDAEQLSHAATNASSTTVNKISNKEKGSYRKPRQHKQKVNYEQLGIAGLCLRCGKSGHFAKECRSSTKLKCNSCAKQGHVAKVCIASLLASSPNAGPKTKHSTRVNSTNQVQNDNSDYGIYEIVDVYTNDHKNTNCERYYAQILIEGKMVKFEVDSGSGYSFLPKNLFEELGLSSKITPTNIVFRSYTQNTFTPEGKVSVSAKYNNISIVDDLYIVPNHCSPLIGRTWIRRLGINLNDLDQINSNVHMAHSISDSNQIEDLLEEFSSVFEEKIGCVPHYKVSLQLRENVKPIYTKERQIPFSLKERVDKELDDLEKEGIISKVANSDWGSPLVVIPKADGGVRLCVDYKVGVNQRLVSAHYPIPKIDQIFNSLKDSKYFCKLDLYKAYLHVPVDESSSQIQTISTHRGTYRMNRLSFGIKTAPAEFNRIMDQILREIPKTEVYFDDITIHGESLSECKANLKSCLAQLKKYDLHLNLSKCKFFQKQIHFLGHTVEYNKIQKCNSKIKAIVDMPKPKCVEDVRRFLGMVTYYSRFIPNASTITSPLRLLLHKNTAFKWNSNCQKAFNLLKKEIASDRVLMPFNPDLKVQLACDASPTGIAGVLSHVINDEERPIAFASRSLTPAEQNYSQLDREALAIVYAVQHFHEYLYGRLFTLVTDNQPLSRIFHQNSKLPQMTSSRLQRYAAFLTGYNYEVVTEKSEENVNADCLSRAALTTDTNSINFIDQEVHSICNSTLFQISSSDLNFNSIRNATKEDAQLVKILSTLRSSNIPESEYTIDSEILFKGNRVVVPTSLQSAVLNELHYSHIGITKMKQLARKYVYWPSIDKDIERYVRSCSACASVQNNPPKVILHPWEEPQENWQRIHIDYAGPFQGYQFLVAIDSKSKWAEVGVISSAPTSYSTIEMLSSIFARNGYPNVMVSDNAPIFKSEEFSKFCSNAGIFQKFIAPGHPATNGLAERNVQTLKKRLMAMSDDPSPIGKKVQNILFRYRATPLANGRTPSEQYLGRQIRIQLDALKPSKSLKTSAPETIARQLNVGDRVQARYYTGNKPSWKFGTITEKLGRLHYIVRLDNGFIFKRHINQLRLTNVSAPDTSPSPDQETDSSSHTEIDPQILQHPALFPHIHNQVPSQDTSAPSNTNAPDTPTAREQPQSSTSANTESEATLSRRTSGRQRKPPTHHSDYIRH